jgi:death on curing protein
MSRFLEMKHIHTVLTDQLTRYGGEHGIRDEGLVKSAVAAPQAQFGGERLHDGPVAQAAAYLFHLCSNHPFVDGNKRVALAAALVFLDLHEIEVYDRADVLYELVMKIARSEITKEETTTRLAELCSPSIDTDTTGESHAK